jgi:DivIVA domain-containing protein
MESSKSTQQSSLDSLRTVEFRQTLRGYHIDDVDEYLERVAVEAEALQEQFRQSNERLRQAADRIAQLEHLLAEAKQREQQRDQQREQQQVSAPQPERVADDTLQRTLLLAQKFVDETKAEAEVQARAAVAKAEEQARALLSDAETRARSAGADTERKLREDVGRLEARRSQLKEEIETAGRHIDAERSRLRSALAEMMLWVDKNLHHVGASEPERGEEGQSRSPANGGSPLSQHQQAAGRDDGAAAQNMPAAGPLNLGS